MAVRNFEGGSFEQAADISAEALVEKAAEIRGRRRPRVGIGRSTDGKSARDVAAEPVARPAR
jgi:hypothetical protein